MDIGNFILGIDADLIEVLKRIDSLPSVQTVFIVDDKLQVVGTITDGDIIKIYPGVYSGPGNYDLNFEGKLLLLNAPNDPNVTIIDCNNSGRALSFHSGETSGAAVIGFTIKNGQADYGGAISCIRSSPQIRNCLITENVCNGFVTECTGTKCKSYHSAS